VVTFSDALGERTAFTFRDTGLLQVDVKVIQSKRCVSDCRWFEEFGPLQYGGLEEGMGLFGVIGRYRYLTCFNNDMCINNASSDCVLVSAQLNLTVSSVDPGHYQYYFRVFHW
jgi:hypothetical protein